MRILRVNENTSIRRRGLWAHGRLAAVIAVGVVAATFGVGVIASALSDTANTTPASLVVAHSSTLPHVSNVDESLAPNVPTPGGASQGSGNFNAVSCPSTTLCIAVGGDNNLRGVAATSSDGGLNWQNSPLSTTPVTQLDAVTCVDAKHCVAVGEGAISTTSNSGASWTPRTLPTANTTLLGVSCPSTTACVAVGVSPGNAGPLVGQLVVSSDGGATWSTPTLPANIGALGSVDCPSVSFCVAVGAQILVSNDGGTTWNAVAVNGGTNVLRSVSCSSTTTCVALGANPVGAVDPTAGAFEVVTTDGGATWTSVSTPAGSASLVAISCTAGNACTAAGVSDVGAAPVYSSGDDGMTWTQETIPGSVTAVSAVRCRSGSDCVFVGREGNKPSSGHESSGAPWRVTTISTVALTAKVGA